MKKTSLISILLLITGCLHNPQTVEEPFEGIQGFSNIFEGYEEFCPYFAYKGINWVEITSEYYPEAASSTSDEEFLAVISDMLAELQDPAINLFEVDSQWQIVDIIYPFSITIEPNYDMDVLLDNYLPQYGWAGWEDGYVEGLGWCDPDILPYLFLDSIPGAGQQYALAALDAFVADCILLDVPAVIVDIRMSSSSTGSNSFIGRFAEKSYPGAIYRSRNGPEYDQYTDSRPVTYPSGPKQYTGIVYLLVGENCRHRAEIITASFLNFPNVVLVGDTTGGSVSMLGNIRPVIGNWWCAVPSVTILTYDKHWIEGNGIYPDILINATEADFAAGVDPVLDYAIEMLDSY